jgi:hypothetical protein
VTNIGKEHLAEVIELVALEAEAQGWTVLRRSGGEWRFLAPPDGRWMAQCAPRAWPDTYAVYAIHNVICALVLLGFDWRGNPAIFVSPIRIGRAYGQESM